MVASGQLTDNKTSQGLCLSGHVCIVMCAYGVCVYYRKALCMRVLFFTVIFMKLHVSLWPWTSVLTSYLVRCH